jgi:hypothetical protein
MLGLGALSFMMGRDWGEGATWAASIYGVLITVFLGLQIYGFVSSQVDYSEEVEDAKYDLLEIEGIMDFALPKQEVLPSESV